jgi:hypothetical protein
MAQVLAVVPQADSEALVAVELVLEGMAPSGSISVEHVRNVLARLNTSSPRSRPRLAASEPGAGGRYGTLRPAATDPSGSCGRTGRPCDTANDVQAQLKALRLNGMAAAWADLTEQGVTPPGRIPLVGGTPAAGRGCRRAMRSIAHRSRPDSHAPRSGSSTRRLAGRPAVDQEAGRLSFTQDAQNVVLVGGPGTGPIWPRRWASRA